MRLLQSLQRRILHSVLILIRKQVRQSSLVWVSFTLRSSLTVFSVSSRLRQTLVHLRLLTRRHLQRLLIRNTNMLSSQVDVDSTDTVRYVSSQWMPMEKNFSSSIQRLSVVLFQRSTSHQLAKVSRRLQRPALLVDSQ